MKKLNTLSLLLLVGLPLLNFAIVAAIVRIDHWFLVSLTYPAVFGILFPVALLVAYWIFARKAVNTVLPWIVSLMIVVCGVAHFIVLVMASASV